MTIQRVEQVVSQRLTTEAEAQRATPAPQARAAVTVQPNAAWQRLTSTAASPTGLSLPAKTNVGVRTAETRTAGDRRVAIAAAEAQLNARRAIAEASLADVDSDARSALEPIFAAEIADYARQLEALKA